MRHKLEAAGFEGRALEIDAGLLKKTLWVDGSPAPKGRKMGQYLLLRNDGREVTTKWPSSFDPAPQILIDGQLVRTAPALAWYEWIVVGLPLGLLFVGGALGGLLGAVASLLNARLIRSSLPLAVRYLAGFALTGVAVAVYALIAGAIQGAIRH